jgi:hypothetical protein
VKRAVLCCLVTICGCSDDGTAGGSGTDTGLTGTTSTGGDTEAGATMEMGSTGGASSSSTSGASTTTAGPLTTGDETDDGTTGGDVPHVIYVNFDGGDFSNGPDDATTNTAGVLTVPMTIAAYDGDTTMRATVLSTIEADFAPFSGGGDLTVTDVRPDAGPYTMVVITPTNFLPFPGGGVAALDCDDATPSNVAFSFTDDEDDPGVVGAVASSRLGVTFGIEPTDEPLDLSYDQVWSPGDDPSWLDQCIAPSFAQTCTTQHAVHCKNGEQNAYAALAALFGT